MTIEIDMLGVHTEPSPITGAYLVVVTYGDDLAVHLDDAAAATYGAALLGTLARAEYDALVVRKLMSLGLDQRTAGQSVIDLRADRPPLVHPGTMGPLRFEPCVNEQLVYSVQVKNGTRTVAQLEPAEVRQHAQHVIEAPHVALLDDAYRRYLVGVIGLDDSTARAAVGALGLLREG